MSGYSREYLEAERAKYRRKGLEEAKAIVESLERQEWARDASGVVCAQVAAQALGIAAVVIEGRIDKDD